MSVQFKRWTLDEYERLVRLGMLDEDDRVQLIEGEIVEMPPEGPPHAAAVELIAEALRRVLSPDHHVRVGHPMALRPDSEPEPDVAIVYRNPQPGPDRRVVYTTVHRLGPGDAVTSAALADRPVLVQDLLP